MQGANTAAPRILDAIVTLGQASDEHISYALLGLPPHMYQNAQEAAATLRRISWRIASRRIASSVRVDMAALHASSTCAADLTPADWSSPYNVAVGNGDFLPLLVQHYPNIASLDWPVRDRNDYSITARLALLNHAWAAAVRAWWQEECKICLLGGGSTDFEVTQSFIRLSPNVMELQLHADPQAYGETIPVAIGSGEYVGLLSPCAALHHLLLRGAHLEIATVVALMDALPSLQMLDLACTTLTGGPVTDLVAAVAARPELRLYVQGCDALVEAAGADDAAARSTSWFDCGIPASQLGAIQCTKVACATCAAHADAVPFRYGFPAWAYPYHTPVHK